MKDRSPDIRYLWDIFPVVLFQKFSGNMESFFYSDKFSKKKSESII